MTSSRSKSDIWKLFSVDLRSESKAKCLICGTLISRGSCGNRRAYTTTNMWNHANKFHSSEVISAKKNITCEVDESDVSPRPPEKRVLSQTTLPAMVSKKTKYLSTDPRAQEMTRAVAEMICVDMQPLDIVNNKGFKQLMEKAVPKYELPSRKHLSTVVIPSMFEDVKQRVKTELKDLQTIAVTTDIWTSGTSSQINDYLSVTAHGVNAILERKSYCLEVHPFEGDNHSAHNIAENLRNTFTEWEIESRVCAVVTDNAANMINAVSELGKDVVRCLAHSVQLVLKQGLMNEKPIRDMISKGRAVVGHFNHSTSAKKVLNELQVKLNAPEHVLLQDVATRWDSTLKMLRRLIEQRLPVTAALQSVSCNTEINAKEWALAEEVVDVLQYFEEVTHAVSNEKTSVADSIPLVNSLHRVLDDKIKKGGSTLVTLKNLKHALSSRFSGLESTKLYVMATTLDPRYKTRAFLEAETNQRAKGFLIEEAMVTNQETYLETQKNEPSTSNCSTPSTSNCSTQSTSNCSTNTKGIWSFCHELVTDRTASGSEETFSKFQKHFFIAHCKFYISVVNLLIMNNQYQMYTTNIALPYLFFIPVILE